MGDYKIFLYFAIILLFTKVFGLFTKKAQMPQVVGALIAGLILGPSVLNLVSEDHVLVTLSELGVIILMFTAGLETDLHQMKKVGVSASIIAVIGVILPLGGGYLCAMIFDGGFTGFNQQFLQNIFIGIVLTATSVSITVEALREMGKLKSKVGLAILGAAIIDDILGIIALTIITSLSSSNGGNYSMLFVLMRILGFFAFSLVVGIGAKYFFKYLYSRHGRKRRIPIFGFILCLLLAYIAEEYFAIADITGAYIAGIIITSACGCDYITEKMEVTSYMLMSPIFFAVIGIKTNLLAITPTTIVFAIVLTIVAILTKIFGCSIGAKITGFNKKDSLRIGVGMVCRGEVALIVANKGAASGLLNPAYFEPIIFMVIFTTLITPIMLKLLYKKKNKKHDLNASQPLQVEALAQGV
jgi:Kef-type K+ transport system membrane component KefB